MLGEQEFRLLNRHVELSDASEWNRTGRDKLLTYHLHYMDDLSAGEFDVPNCWHANLIDRWIDENPIGYGNGWEPYTLSLRIVNWIKWQLGGNQLSDSAVLSLYQQARALRERIEYHLLANHLFANAKALFFAGTFFSGEEAAAWRQTGLAILHKEIGEQLLADGGHFELSPMYHSIILDDVLDILNLCRASNTSTSVFESAARRMLTWLAKMTHPDGSLAYFNDSTPGVSPSLAELGDYASRLDVSWSNEIGHGLELMEPSGYARCTLGAGSVLVDVGEIGPDYQPGHGHCDCLSFEASIRGVRCIVNSGISTYNVCERRSLERGTASHNTVSVGNTEQSEIWSAFRVGRRARPVIHKSGPNYLHASLHGFGNPGATHTRKFDFHNDRFEIKDRVSATSGTDTAAVAHFHFHPDINLEIAGPEIHLERGRLEFANAAHIHESEFEYSCGFNSTKKGKKVLVHFVNQLTTIIWYESSVHHR